MGKKGKQNRGAKENKPGTSVTVSSETNIVSKLSSNCCIYKVPRILFKIKEEAYTPQLVSIGPFHLGKEWLKPMEGHKRRYLNDFLDKDRKRDRHFYIQNLKGIEEKIRQCYGEIVELDSNEFIELMLLDGCFIIEIILKFGKVDLRHTDDPIFSSAWTLNAIRLDMALLENQLPFFLLKHLFNLINGPDQQYSLLSLHQLILRFFIPDVLGCDVPHDTISREVKHLVHFLRKGYVPSDKRLPLEGTGLEFIPSATELRNAGVKFRKAKGESFLDVRFINGIFLIPPIKIDSSSDTVIRNIIAFELFDRRPNYISQYITLMDCLINTADDVALLRASGIINNRLGDNEKVATLFNKFCDGAMIDTKSFYYAQLCEDVNAYYKKIVPKMKATLKRDYFNTPWSYVSFSAALILLICTIIQTVKAFF